MIIYYSSVPSIRGVVWKSLVVSLKLRVKRKGVGGNNLRSKRGTFLQYLLPWQRFFFFMNMMPDCFGSQYYGLLDVPDDTEYPTFL